MNLRITLKIARRRAWLLKRQIALAVTLTAVAVGFVTSAITASPSVQRVEVRASISPQ